ncbi:DUF2290 domain-containing protein [Confluentibacter citreus]|uniref:DUF2290 domain-containing protein n=1 Tax=Confluentibacter citreus TaxID=2007307 RepID=UPI000C285523|nr:DUF2290 domain-containing protein [Confluentibacter citreus]
MINEATFNISINESIKLLKEISLFKDIGPKKGGEYSSAFKKISKKNKHIELYNAIRDNLDYEIVLFDDSFLQFSYNQNYLRFAFIQNPSFSYTKYDYLKILFSETDLYGLSEDEMSAMINENEFEQFLNEQQTNSNLVYIRYDFDRNGYNPLLHSCSHIHIGLSENLRIPSSIVLTPLEFVFFSIKQCYYAEWKLYHESFTFTDLVTKRYNSKKLCPLITDPAIWDINEQNEIWIT